MKRREHWGSCRVAQTSAWFASWETTWLGWPYPTMEGAIEALDPFQARPLLHVSLAYVGRYISGEI